MGNLHAILILVCPLLVSVAIWQSVRFKTRLRDWLGPIGLMFAAILLVGGMRCGCYEGGPFYQWAVPAVCIGFCAFIAAKSLRRVLIAVLLVVAIGLWANATNLVHTDDWTGNSTWDGGQIRVLQNVAHNLAADPKYFPRDDRNISAGWIEDVRPDHKFSLRFSSSHRRIVTSHWHSGLTNLHSVVLIPVGVWYPGGRWEDGVKNFKIRDRE